MCHDDNVRIVDILWEIFYSKSNSGHLYPVSCFTSVIKVIWEEWLFFFPIKNPVISFEFLFDKWKIVV